MCNGWNMYDVFNAVDAENKGFVSPLDIQRILLGNSQISINIKDLDFLLRIYDHQGNRKISMERFLDELSCRIESDAT